MEILGRHFFQKGELFFFKGAKTGRTVTDGPFPFKSGGEKIKEDVKLKSASFECKII